MQLVTTGNRTVRFNPNLYADGKVCLSLLGTWRGHATENWDPKISTILQVLISVQSIIMSEEVYFNEPGYEHEAGTPNGEKKNTAYGNIVKYGNVKYAMLGMLKNPPKGFESVVKRHFYIKKQDVIKTCRYWVQQAGEEEAMYRDLVESHNSQIARDFQKDGRYKEALTKCVEELEDMLNKLDKPVYEIKQKPQKKKSKKQKAKKLAIDEGKVNLDDVDMNTDSEDDDQKAKMIDTTQGKEIDVDDDAVKDRWSRYIGAMGVEAVAKQAAANIFVSGAGALGIEISKNLVLAGCKSFTLHDIQKISFRDLSGQFFINKVVEGKSRAEECMSRLQQLNYYVKCKTAPSEPIPLDVAKLEAEPWNFQNLDVIILTEADYETISFVDQYCHSKSKKFILANLNGVYGRVFCDFGPDFTVLDKNGEELQEVMLKSITNEEQGLVTLLQDGAKHNFEDGDEIVLTEVKGMKLKEGEKHDDPEIKSPDINGTIHKVTVVSPNSFKIGDTRKYTEYEQDGIGKQLRVKNVMKFKPFSEVMTKTMAELPFEMNLQYLDFLKMEHNMLSHVAFEALDEFNK